MFWSCNYRAVPLDLLCQCAIKLTPIWLINCLISPYTPDVSLILRSQPQPQLPLAESELPELAWILPPVSTNERAGYNEHIRLCFRYDHSYKEKVCEISTSAKTHVLTRYKEAIYTKMLAQPPNRPISSSSEEERLNLDLSIARVLRNNNPVVDTRYCLMTLFIDPLGVHHQCHKSGAAQVTRCHAETRGVTNVTWALSWMLSSDTLTSDTYETPGPNRELWM